MTDKQREIAEYGANLTRYFLPTFLAQCGKYPTGYTIPLSHPDRVGLLLVPEMLTADEFDRLEACIALFRKALVCPGVEDTIHKSAHSPNGQSDNSEIATDSECEGATVENRESVGAETLDDSK